MLAAILTICGATVLTSFSKNDNPIVPTDDSSQFVTITDVVPDVILEIRYFGTYNFVGTRIDGYEETTALLTRQAMLRHGFKPFDTEWWHFTLKKKIQKFFLFSSHLIVPLHRI